MNVSKERYVVDENENRIGVILDIANYQQLLEELEELGVFVPMMLLRLLMSPFHLLRQLLKLSKLADVNLAQN